MMCFPFRAISLKIRFWVKFGCCRVHCRYLRKDLKVCILYRLLLRRLPTFYHAEVHVQIFLLPRLRPIGIFWYLQTFWDKIFYFSIIFPIFLLSVSAKPKRNGRKVHFARQSDGVRRHFNKMESTWNWQLFIPQDTKKVSICTSLADYTKMKKI